MNIFRWPGRHQWSITGGQRAGGHPGRQVLAKLRLRSNIRVITRNYTEHVDGLAEADSPTTTNVAATTSSSFFFFSSFTAITSSFTSTYYFVLVASPSSSRSRSRYREAFPLLSPPPPPRRLIPRSRFRARSLHSLARSRVTIESAESWYLYHRHRRHHLRYRLHRLSFLHAVSARGSRPSLGSAQLEKFSETIMQYANHASGFARLTKEQTRTSAASRR